MADREGRCRTDGNSQRSSDGSTTHNGGSTRHSTISNSNFQCIYDGSATNQQIFQNMADGTTSQKATSQFEEIN